MRWLAALLVLLLAVPAALVLPAAAQGDGAAPAPASAATPGTTVVTANTTWTGRVDVPGDLIVRGATLTLSGATLRVGGRIEVETGAHLDMHPSGANATDVGPLDGAAPDETHGLWVVVNGTLSSSGTPATELHGFRGTGLNNLYFAGGGVQVRGRAALADVHLADGNGTLTVWQGGAATLERAHVERMGFLALGALGHLTLRNSTVEGSAFGLMGHSPCVDDVEGTRIVAEPGGEPIQANACAVTVRHTHLEGGANGMYLAGSADATLQDVDILGYTQNGISTLMLPDPAHPTAIAQPVLRLEGVRLRPSNATKAANANGLSLDGTQATIANSTVAGNRIGILAKDQSLLRLSASAIVDNRAVGVLGQDVRIGGDLLAGNRFDGDAVPVDVAIAVQAVVLDAYGRPLPGVGLRVYGPDATTPVVQVVQANATAVQARLFAFDDKGGVPRFLGPFTYDVARPGAAPVHGTLDLANPTIRLYADTPATTVSTGPLAWLPGLMAGLGVVLVIAAFLPWRRLRRALRL